MQSVGGLTTRPLLAGLAPAGSGGELLDLVCLGLEGTLPFLSLVKYFLGLLQLVFLFFYPLIRPVNEIQGVHLLLQLR